MQDAAAPLPEASAPPPSASDGEERLVKLYMELTGESERRARSVYAHLNLMRGIAGNSRADSRSRQNSDN